MADVSGRARRQSTRRQFLSIATAGGTAAALAGVAGSGAGRASAQASDSIVGSWLCTYSRSTGEAFTGLLTFHENGTVISSTSDHLAGSAAHGVWTSLGGGQYAYSVMRLNIDSAGAYTGLRVVDADLTVDPSGKSWNSASRTIYYDPSGALLRTLSSTATATRIPLVRRTDPHT